MRIGIEAQRIFRRKKHGMDIVIIELIKALQLIDRENNYFIFVREGEDPSISESENFKIIEVPGLTYADWEQIQLPKYAEKYKLDVLHTTSNTGPIRYRGKLITTLHDVIFLERNKGTQTQSTYQLLGRLYRKWVVPRVMKHAAKILTVSHYEKKEIADKFQDKANDIEVVYNAFSSHFIEKHKEDAIQKIRLRYKLPDQYIFFIGNTDPKKNMFRTIRGYRQYCLQAENPLPLVIADIDEKFLLKVLKDSKALTLRQRIYLTGYVHNHDLPKIYQGAELFLYPSIRESFGIPLLEAMASGIPVISSQVSAIPEIAGNAALLVNPFDEISIGKAIHQVTNDEIYTKNLIKTASAHVQRYSWQNSAENLKTIYQSL